MSSSKKTGKEEASSRKRLDKLRDKKEKLDKKAKKKYERRLRRLQRKRHKQPRKNLLVKNLKKSFFKKDREREYSLHLINKMVGVEQEVAESFGKPISFNETEHYKTLSGEEKKDFEAYLKKKKVRKNLVLVFAFLFGSGCLVGSGIINFSFTGAVTGSIGNVFYESKSFLVNNSILSLSVLLFLIISLIGTISFVIKKKFG